MYRSTVTLSDPWRNFIPEAPDIEITVFAGQATYIALDEILMQGAVDLNDSDTLTEFKLSPPPMYEGELVEEPVEEPTLIKGRYTLESKPTQRGWQLTYDVLNSKTAFGTVDKDQHKFGLLYTSTTSTNAVDCINYFVSNGTQRSQLGTIDLTILRGHDLDISFEYNEEKNLYHISTTKYKPESLGFYWFKITWYYDGPHSEFNEYTKRDEIVRGKRKFLETWWRHVGHWSYYNIAYVQKAESTYLRPFTDANLAGIHDPITNKPYVPLNKTPNIKLSYEVWPRRSGLGNRPDWSFSYKTEIDLNERLGAPWQEYGKRTTE